MHRERNSVSWAGGEDNLIGFNAVHSVVVGGFNNTAGGAFATVPGGYGNTADGASSLAAGHAANAAHQGTFVWADSLGSKFNSTASNQFLVRAAGGMGIGTNSPQAQLHVRGTAMADLFKGAFQGDGSALSNLSIPSLPANLAYLNSNQTFTGTQTFLPLTGAPFNVGSTTKVANLNADLLDGLDSAAFALNSHPHDASNIVSGTLADGRLSPNMAMLNTNAFFSGSVTTLGDLAGVRLRVGANQSLAGTSASIAGGTLNTNQAGNAFIGGGDHNLINGGANYTVLAGGQFNTIQSNAFNSAIGGGYANSILSSATYATIPGGNGNQVGGSYSLAAGNGARANHNGTLVWADNSAPGTPFASTSNNQFLVRATGGVGIGTNNPQSALHVIGTVRADNFIGNGAGLTNLPAASVPTNTAFLNSNQTFTASNTFTGVVSALNGTNQFAGTFTGNGAGLTNLIMVGIPANTAFLNSNQTFTASNTFAGVVTAVNGSNQFAGTFTGNGAGLTNLPTASLPATTAFLTSNQIFSASNVFLGVVTATNASNQLAGKFSGDGTALNLSNTINTTALQNSSITALKIAAGQVVKSLNGLTDNLTLAAGANVTISNSGSTITVSSTGGGAASNAWNLTGNGGTTSNQFLGTTDGQPLVLKVNNQQVGRYELPASASPNIIAGSASNAVGGGAIAATIAGGYNNRMSNSYATMGGGADSVVTGFGATIAGGRFNRALNEHISIGGGLNNTSTAPFAVISGGADNLCSGFGATIPGGTFNMASGDFSFAGGHIARASHAGTFVWSDSQNIPFGSSTNDQFLIRASGGVGVGRTNPAAQFDVSSTGGDAFPQVRLNQDNGAEYTRLRFTQHGDYSQRWDFGMMSNRFNLYSGYFGRDFLLCDINGVSLGNNNLFLFGNVTANSFIGDGGGLANVWKLGGNSGTTSGNFVGTTDTQPLEFRVNNGRALRMEYASTSPNLIGGYSGNNVTNSAVGGTVGGGGKNEEINSVAANFGTIGGGHKNTAGALDTTVAGGYWNIASNTAAAVGGGWRNSALGVAATIAGGYLNFASNSFSTIGGGTTNQALGIYSTVAGGTWNFAAGSNSTVSGGTLNYAGNYACVGGGINNQAGGDYASVGGGTGNQAGNSSSTVAGGWGDNASGGTAFVGGGYFNTASSFEDTVAGGLQNTASGGTSTVGGGQYNSAGGFCATVPGGVQNVAAGQYSFAAGQRAEASHNGTFVWADSTTAYFTSTRSNQFLIRAGGGVGIGTNNPVSALHVVGTVTATTFNPPSDRNLKENFAPVNGCETLAKVAALPITRWNFRGDAQTPHLGPMAQDFHAAFGLGTDDKHIATVDADGVTLTAIQGLNEKLDETVKDKDAQITALRKKNESLEKRVAELERLMQKLALTQASR